MESIDIFPWDHHFNTGLATIDEQHAHLVELLNVLAREVAFRSNDLRLNQIFNELLDYTVYHFETEEAIWKEYLFADPMEEQHQALHQEFIDTVLRLKEEQNERSSLEIAEEMLGSLARWLAFHILETDRYMAYTVLALKEGLDMDGAKQHATQSMSGFTRTLIDLILSIYETLSANTLQLMYEIRKQKQLEEKVDYETHYENILLDFASSFINLSLDQIEPTINAALERMVTFVNADRGYIFEYDFINRTMSNTYEWCQNDISHQIDLLQNLPIDTIPEWLDTHIRGETILIHDVAQLPPGNLRDILEPQEIKSLVTLPLMYEGNCQGFVGFDAVRKHHTFDKGEIRMLELFAILLAHVKDRKRIEMEKKESESKLRLAARVFTHSREGIMITTDDGIIIDVNNAFTRITGYPAQEVMGRNPSLLKSGKQGNEFYRDMWSGLMQQGHWYGEVWNRRKNGEVYAELLTISTIFQEDGEIKNYVALFSDISTIKEHEKQLEHIAHYDALTGLANRVLLSDRLEQAMIQASRRGGHLAVAYLDLDGFKEINDKYGHEAGDQLLMEIAANMKLSLREGDTLSRLGGDEFVAVLLDLNDFEASIPTLTRLLSAAAQPVVYGNIVLEVSASLGVTFYPQLEEMQADQLLRQADQAMYQAKQAGKNRFHLFDAQQDRSIRVHHENMEEVHHALKKEQFVLYYQPKVNMRTGELIGAEALIRWQHPTQGLLFPASFLPEIEDCPLAIEVGEWVIHTALTQIGVWQSMGLTLKISVNIGARQLQQNDFVERLKFLLGVHPNVSPAMLELEVLETSALEDMSKVSKVMSECKKMGIDFALDDFGTGYSSLTYLKHLPVSLLKIDQSFVHDMLYDPDDLAILEGVLGLGTAFRREVIAEGVETLEHGRMLLQLGCELAQGYGIARPMPANDLPAWASSWKPDPSWLNRNSVNRDEVQLLYATVEHSAWVNEIKMFLKDRYAIVPMLNPKECRFGEWLNSKKSQKFSNEPSFSVIKTLHEQVHTLAAELCDLKNSAHDAQALAGIPQLQALRDTLNKTLLALVEE